MRIFFKALTSEVISFQVISWLLLCEKVRLVYMDENSLLKIRSVTDSGTSDTGFQY